MGKNLTCRLFFEGTKKEFFWGKANINASCFHGQQQWAFRLTTKKENYDRSFNQYIACCGATKSAVSSKQNKNGQKQYFLWFWISTAGIIKFMSPTPHQATNDKNFNIEFCPLGDCNLAQNICAVRQETNWFKHLYLKLLTKRLSYYYIPCRILLDLLSFLKFFYYFLSFFMFFYYYKYL